MIAFRRPASRLWKFFFVLTRPFQQLALYIAGHRVRTTARVVFDNDYYYQANPQLAGSGLLSAMDYFLFGAGEGRDPHPLFSTSYYLEQNADVRKNRCNPLLHYVGYGAREGRNPHPLFDGAYYQEKYPDVQRKRENPLLHYLRLGQYEHRQPSPLFDPEFYRATQVDVIHAGNGALTHYLQHGFREGRAPEVHFDPVYYLKIHSDVARAGLEPFTHYVRFGKGEGRKIRTPRFESEDERNYLPVEVDTPCQPPPVSVDVIIPVYRGMEETRTCLQSVLTAQNLSQFRVIVVNDATPEPALGIYLRELAAENKIHLIEHATNIGFVGSVNEGMSLHPGQDVVLLNSDTEVFSNWLDRLASHAYSGRVASVTPLSNNATICSYPKFCENNTLPESTTGSELDCSIRRANAGRHCNIPTAVGFCMYIRRDALQDVGLFDQAAFGRGYGEENDFCMRALDRGWRHLLAADTFVYHAGSVSFGPANESQQRAMEALLDKHPRYMDHVRWHFQINPAIAFRISATLYRLRSDCRAVRMNVLHSLGGGTSEHVRNLQRLTGDNVIWLLLAPANDGCVSLSCELHGFEFSLVLDPIREHGLLLNVLGYVALDRVHVHHLLGFPIDIEKLLDDLGLPYDVTLHDYYFICPRINLTDSSGRYCGESKSGCQCQEITPSHGSYLDLFSWRAVHGSFLSRASRIIAPSADTAVRFKRYFPWLSIVSAWHEFVATPVVVKEVGQNENLRVAVLGVMAMHKGFENLRKCVALAEETDAPVDFTLIGSFDLRTATESHKIASTGWYQPEEIASLLLRYDPHIVWFPCQWPETFSYTLSACLGAGLPVAVPDLGAFAERVAGREWSWVLPWDTTSEDWLAFFVQVRNRHFRNKVRPPVHKTTLAAELHFYRDKFLESAPTKQVFVIAPKPKRSVLALPSIFSNGQIQACGYIRIIQPLTHPDIAPQIELAVVDLKTALRLSGDALLVQRTAVVEQEAAEQLIDHCRKHGMRLIYEIDDDLFRLPIEHPEHASYAAITKAAKLIARAADTVTVSTEPLRRTLLRYNANVVVIPNCIDERLWIQPTRPNVTRHSSSTIRALYMGTTSHRMDLAMLEGPVLRMKKEFDFELSIIGVTSDPGPWPWFSCIPVPDQIAISYPGFVKWLSSAGDWDLGLAPLKESPFNLHKSAIKVYEYAAFGMPAIASAITPYNSAIDDGKTGLLVPNTEQDWYESLKLVCESVCLRQRLTSGVISRRAKWTLGENAQKLQKAWEQTLFEGDQKFQIAPT